jgi:hypothetical protein
MTERDFIYWLNGFFELSNPSTLDEKQVQIIKEHLALVLQKTTPTSYSPNIKVNLPTFPTGPQCGVCKKLTSEEGGVCKKCRDTTTTLCSSGFDPDMKINVSEDMLQDLKVFTGVELQTNIKDEPIVDVPTCLTC